MSSSNSNLPAVNGAGGTPTRTTKPYRATPSPPLLPLSDKQKRFCEEYVVDLNGAKAAIRAGYSKKSAGEIAYQHLKKLHFQAYLSILKAKRATKLEVSQETVLRELASIARSDLRNIFTPEGRLRPPQDWDDATAAAVKSIEVVTTMRPDGQGGEIAERTHKVRLWDKNRAAELIGRHLGLFDERVLAPPDPSPEAKDWTVKVIPSKLSPATDGAKND